MKPVLLAGRLRRSTAPVGNLATRARMPLRSASPSLNPTCARGGICEHAVGNQPVARASLPSGQIVPNDAEVVLGYVGELRAAGAFAERPDVGRARLQPLVDANVAAAVQLDAGLVEPDAGGVRNTTRRDQDVAALDILFALARPHGKADLLVRTDHAHRRSSAGDQKPECLRRGESAASPRETSGSSRPMSWGPASMIVTRLPKRR